jgi:ankyrin repeat protein
VKSTVVIMGASCSTISKRDCQLFDEDLTPEVARSILQKRPKMINKVQPKMLGRMYCPSSLTSLHVAAWKGNLDVVRILIDSGAIVNCVVAETGDTPLMFACGNGHIDVVTYLLDHGADIDVQNRSGSTALLEACIKRSKKVAMELISRGANINIADSNGITPLLLACEQKDARFVHELVDHGADVTVVDKDGATPLLPFCTDRPNNVRFATNMEMVKFMLDRGASTNGVVLGTGKSALIMAVQAKNEPIAKILVESGCDLNITDHVSRIVVLMIVNSY